MEQLLLALPPDRSVPEHLRGVTPAHMAYRIGPGPRLLGVRLPPDLKGGLMLLDCREYDGSGDPVPCCRQILGECRRRSFRGIVCDFEGAPAGSLSRLVNILDRNCQAQGWALYVPPAFAPFAPGARVLLPSALTAGTLERRLREGVEQYGRGRTALAIQWVREDFLLPVAHAGRPITQAELDGQIRRLEPAAFFDRGLCAHYYTYMAQGGQAHFVLFDTPRSIREKLAVARRLNLPAALLPGPDVLDCLEEVLAEGGAPGK